MNLWLFGETPDFCQITKTAKDPVSSASLSESTPTIKPFKKCMGSENKKKQERGQNAFGIMFRRYVRCNKGGKVRDLLLRPAPVSCFAVTLMKSR